VTKTEAIKFAKKFNWTAADAERAFKGINFQEADEQALLEALVKFAGTELNERQRKQAAQKGQVTKKTNYIKEIETKFASKVSEYEEALEQQRSLFVGLIAGIYKLAKPLGPKDPWIEALLATYEEDKKDAA
jgi:hypothetical protein